MLKNYSIITARCASSRLPNKIFKNLNSQFKSIDILIKRAKKIKLPIIVATSKNKSDDKLCNYIKKYYKISIFRGQNKNKLLRWYDCFKKFNIKNACIIDGDDIFFDYNIYRKLIQKMKNFDILSVHKSVITGIFTHILSNRGLKKMYKYFKIKNIDSEMIEPFVKKAKLNRKIINLEKIYRKKGIRITLDYKEDLKLFKLILNRFQPSTDSKKIIKYLFKNKDISGINYFRELNWKQNQKFKISNTNI